MSYVRRDRVEVEPGAPVVEPAVVQQPVVQQPVVQQPVASTRHTMWARTFSIPAVVAGIAAIILIVFGAVALARTDLDSPLSEPIVSVAGVDHNAVLGIVELVAGIGLLIAAACRSRGAIIFMSVVIGIAALVALIEPTVTGDTMPVERGFAAVVAIGAAIVLLTAVLTPSVRRVTQVVEPGY